VIWLIPLLVGCATQSKSTGDGPDFSDTPLPLAEGLLPALNVEHPVRASFDNRGSGTVRGSVHTGAGSIDAFTVNREDFEVENTGRFEADMPWTPGIQILSTRVEGSNGERAVDGRAFHAGPVNAPESWIAGAIRMEVGAEILDDDDPEPDDLAGLLELAFEDESLLDGIIGNPMDLSTAIFTPHAVSYGRVRIDLVPGTDTIEAAMTLDGFAIDFGVEGVGLYSLLSTVGSAWASSVDMAMAVTVVSTGGIVRAEVTDVDVVINGFGVTLDYVPGFIEEYIADWAKNFMVEAIVDMAHKEVASAIENVMSGFAIGATFDVDLALGMRLAEIHVVPEGIRFEADARIFASSPMDLPPNAGSLATAGDAPDWPTNKEQAFWGAIDDDLLNQLSFSFWAAGMLRDFEVDAVVLGALSGGPLPPPLGPAENIQMTLNLPPVLTPSQNEDWAAQLAIGEWELTFNRADGEVLAFSVSCRTHTQVEMNEAGKIVLSADARPTNIDLAVGVLQAPEALDPGDLSALIRLMVPPLLGNASSFSPTIPVPEIPLDEFLSLPSTEGKVLSVDDPSVHLEPNGWMILQAGISVR